MVLQLMPFPRIDGRIFRRLGRIQLVTANAGIVVMLTSPACGWSSPQDIVAVKDVDIFINQNNIF